MRFFPMCVSGMVTREVKEMSKIPDLVDNRQVTRHTLAGVLECILSKLS